MKVEHQGYSQNVEFPMAGDAVSFLGYGSVVNIVVRLSDGAFVLIDLSDGCQMWDTRDTIKELMEQTGRNWTILKNAKVITG